MTKPFQGGHIVDLRSQNWKCWNVELNLGLSDPRIQPFPTQLLWESSQTAITEVMGTQENVAFGYTGRLGIQEECVDGEEAMVRSFPMLEQNFLHLSSFFCHLLSTQQRDLSF